MLLSEWYYLTQEVHGNSLTAETKKKLAYDIGVIERSILDEQNLPVNRRIVLANMGMTPSNGDIELPANLKLSTHIEDKIRDFRHKWHVG